MDYSILLVAGVFAVGIALIWWALARTFIERRSEAQARSRAEARLMQAEYEHYPPPV